MRTVPRPPDRTASLQSRTGGSLAGSGLRKAAASCGNSPWAAANAAVRLAGCLRSALTATPAADRCDRCEGRTFTEHHEGSCRGALVGIGARRHRARTRHLCRERHPRLPEVGRALLRPGDCIAAQRGGHPADRHFAVVRIVGDGAVWVSECIITYDGKPSSSISIMEFAGQEVVHETQYFTDGFVAPSWRAALAEPMPDKHISTVRSSIQNRAARTKFPLRGMTVTGHDLLHRAGTTAEVVAMAEVVGRSSGLAMNTRVVGLMLVFITAAPAWLASAPARVTPLASTGRSGCFTT